MYAYLYVTRKIEGVCYYNMEVHVNESLGRVFDMLAGPCVSTYPFSFAFQETSAAVGYSNVLFVGGRTPQHRENGGDSILN